MSILSRFFQFLSKTDRRIIVLCTDHSTKTQVTNGVFVLLTGMFAFLSCMYAILSTFEDLRVAIPIATLYATVIVFIDREIVSATSKAATLSRLPLAFVIGLVVSVPLEMRLFTGRIGQELAESHATKNAGALTQMVQDERAYNDRIKTLENEIAQYRQNIVEAGLAMQDETTGSVRDGKQRTGRAGIGPAHAAAEAQMQRNQQLLTAAQGDLDRLKQEQSGVQARLKGIYDQQVVPQAMDLLAQYEALEKVKAASSSAIYMVWGIRLLIILLEMSPALVKMLQRATEYNVTLEGVRRVNISRVIAITNDQIDQITHNPQTAPRPTILEQLRENPFTS